MSNHSTNESASIGPAMTPLAGFTTASSTDHTSENFTERRASFTDFGNKERRQFASSHSDLSPDAKELAIAIDRYKLENRRRYITCEEMLAVVKQLGYRRE